MKPSTSPHLPLVREITPEELASASPRPRIIDVREPSEFTGELGHIPGAELVPLSALDGSARQWPKEEPLVLVCRSGARSARGAAQLAQLGFPHLLNLAGGMQAYVSAGFAVERG
jgi:rhodanese-related sulfurtransferase